MTAHRFCFCAGLVALAISARAQIVHADPTQPTPGFEVATVKRWNPPPAPMVPAGEQVVTQRVMKVMPIDKARTMSDRVQLTAEARLLLAMAYGVPIGSEKSRIIGLPDWASDLSERYAVNAKMDDATLATLKDLPPKEQRRRVQLMEQQLLTERFHLKVHFETRQLPTYELVVAKGGAKLTQAKPGEEPSITSTDRGGVSEITATNSTLDLLGRAPMLVSDPTLAGHDIVNRTGLAGAYDFKLRYALDRPGDSEPADAPGLFTAIEEQLGLKLVPTKGPVEVIVVDHIERPSEN